MKKQNNKLKQDKSFLTSTDKKTLFTAIYMLCFVLFTFIIYKLGKTDIGMWGSVIIVVAEVFVVVPIFIKKYYNCYNRIASCVRFIPVISELEMMSKFTRILQIVSLIFMSVAGVCLVLTDFIGSVSIDIVPMFFELSVKGFFLFVVLFMIFRGVGYCTVYKDIHLMWLRTRREGNKKKDAVTSTIHFLCCFTAFLPLVRATGLVYNIWKLTDINTYKKVMSKRKMKLVKE